MTEKWAGAHPELDRLVELGEGMLSGSEAEQLKAHLAGCPRCRLELKRLGQFRRDGEAPEDLEILEDTEWARAELELQRSFERDIRPALRTVRRRPAARTWLIRLAPVAAAAVLVVAVLNFDRPAPQETVWNGDGPLRGGEPKQSQILLLQPSEEIAARPGEFIWNSEREFDTYILEVFSPDLEPVFRIADLRETNAVVPDSLLGLLEAGQTYLWNVQGRSGLADAELSLTGWFRIGKPAVGKI